MSIREVCVLIGLVLVLAACSGGGAVNNTSTSTSTTESPATHAPLTSEATTTTEPEGIDLPGLGEPVLVYGPYDHDALVLVDRDGERVVWPGPPDVALSDGRGGVLLQPATESTVVWFPDVEDDAYLRLVTVDDVLLLRGFLGDGRVLYSVRPHPDALTEGSREEFFAVALAEGAQPELVATTPAYESWTIGPALTAGGEAVHASCHLHCSLWPGIAEPTPDGRVVGFVEFDITLPEQGQPELLLLDGESFEELARIELPVDHDQVGHPTISLSADGQRVLVTLGAPAADQELLSAPTTPYLVEGALSGEPWVRRVDVEGAVRWLNPNAASDSGCPNTDESGSKPPHRPTITEEQSNNPQAELIGT